MLLAYANLVVDGKETDGCLITNKKTISVYANGHLAWPNSKAAPGMQIMLDDFWRRGDRQRLFVAKIELTL